MKKLLVLSLVLVVTAILILSSCTTPATPTEPTPVPPAPSPTPPSSEKPIELVFASNSPENVGMSVVHAEWMNKIEEETAGRVKFTAHWASSLLADEESFRGVQDGIADLSPYNPSETSGQRLNMVYTVPFMGTPDMTQSGMIYQQILKEFPEMMAEWPGMIPYAAWCMPAYQIHSTKSLIKVPDDLKGKKVSATGTLAKLVDSVGGAPVQMTVTDWYMSLERGLLEVLPTSYQAVEAFGCTELVPYHSNFTGSGYISPMVILFNQEKWNSLPSDIQKVFTDAEEWFGPAFTENELGFLNFVIKPKMEEWGHTIYDLTPEETQLWVDAAQPFWEIWIEENEQYGPAQEIVDRIQELKAQ